MNPFKVGDVVYTPDGQYTVGEVKDGGCYIGKDNDHKGHRSRWTLCEYLSFTPWPKANHERPIQDGWWVVTMEGADDWPMIRRKCGKNMYDGRSYACELSTSYTFHRFLGDFWK